MITRTMSSHDTLARKKKRDDESYMKHEVTRHSGTKEKT